MSDLSEMDGDAIDRGASVKYLLEPLDAWMNQRDVTEVCVNRPGEVWCERASRWERHDVRALDLAHMRSMATAVAKFAQSEVSDSRPIMSAVLPGLERAQFVLPPASEAGTVSLTIRKPSHTARTLGSYEEQGFFKQIRPLDEGLNPGERELTGLLEKGRYADFLRLAVQLEKNVVVCGETGSGKTTFMRAMMGEIPQDQRIITIEDVPELFLPDHPNHVHLFYPSEASEEAGSVVTAASLLKSCLRMKPNRILLAELRGGETFDFLNVCASGHGGSITSCHAGSPAAAFERMALMVLQNRQGRTLPYEVINRLLRMVVDVVVHVHNDTHGENPIGRHITEIWFDPMSKRQSTKR